MAPENTYKWVQDRLRELHSGALSGDDLRRLNTLAKDDPFIADALEGFALHPEHEHDAALDRLAARIRPVKLTRRRWLIPNLTVTAVAASLMIIVGFWAVMYRLQQDNASSVADNSTVVILPPPLASNPDGNMNAEKAFHYRDSILALEREGLATADERESEAKETNSSLRNSTAAKTESRTIARDEAIGADDKTLSRPGSETTAPPDAPVTSVYSETATVIVEQETDDADPMYFANQMDPAQFARRTAGRVISESGEPLIGASLNIRNTNLGTVSDLDGKFELFLPEKESKVDISFSGYEGTSVELRQGEDDVAILLPESNLARANSKSYKTTGAPEAAGAAVQQQTTYVDYLRNNSRYPLKDNLYTPGRNVTLQFDVTADGSPSRVRVKQSSNDRALDEEALRLLRKGPVWTCEGSAYPCEMEYTIYFR